MRYPFEVPFTEVEANLDKFVSAIFSCLESEFLILPKGEGFVEYSAFENAYESLRQATRNFSEIRTESILQAISRNPLSLVVLRTILGFTPPEWAYLATQKTGVEITQGYARALDRKVRVIRSFPTDSSSLGAKRLEALIETARLLLTSPPPMVEEGKIHRLNKADTKEGIDSIQYLATMGAPYAMLLYERFLGRPFAGHRDAISELVGDSLESEIEDTLKKHGVNYRKTKQAERVPGFDQAPDFIIPDEFNPQVVIEAKVTEDDGTARDKITRVQHLASLSTSGQADGHRKFEVIACIAGRGFGIRREDIKKLIIATEGKVFTPRTLDKLVEHSSLRSFRTKP